MCIKVYEKLVEKNGSCKLCLMCQGRKRKKKQKRSMKKKIERKERRKEKFKNKECAQSGENRSIGENERKMGQKDDICP